MTVLHDPARAFVPYPSVEVPHAPTGPLAGLRFAAKDLFDVAGYPTGGGSPFVLAMSGIKTRNADSVQRLLDAGASLAGKTVTDEFAFSLNGLNAHFGAPLTAQPQTASLADRPQDRPRQCPVIYAMPRSVPTRAARFARLPATAGSTACAPRMAA